MRPLVLIVGPAGAGKTTAVKAVSIHPVASADALDHGRFELPDGRKVCLCALPAQHLAVHDLRLQAVGVVVLCDGMAAGATSDLAHYVNRFRDQVNDHTLVVGITRTDSKGGAVLNSISTKLAQLGANIPVLEVDARDGLQVAILLRILMDRVAARWTRDRAE